MVDATKRPLKLSSEFAVYADKHEIFELMMHLYQNLIVNRPEDPLTYLVNLLKCNEREAFTVIILGPPSSGKHTLAQLLCKVCPSLILVDPIPIIRNYLREETRKLPKNKRPPLPKRYRVPPNVAAHAINSYLNRNECAQGGWIIPGFPRNKTQAVELSIRGIFPQYVINLELRDLKACLRFTNKHPELKTYFMDTSKESKTSSYGSGNSNTSNSNEKSSDKMPNDGSSNSAINKNKKNNNNNNNNTSSTNTTSSSVETVSLKLPPAAVIKFKKAVISFRRNLPDLAAFYQKTIHKVKADLAINEVLESTVEILDKRPWSLAPYNPRIILLGPPGGGKRSLATSLANKYDMVNLHCGELLRQRKARIALDSDYALDISSVRDEYVVSVIKDRLTKIDCVTSGWILRGFPRNPNQAILFRQANFFPNKVIFLDVANDECLDRLLLRRIDPVTGYTYHIRDKTPRDPTISARLVVHPHDRENVVRARLSRYRHHEESLAACYSQSQYMDGRGAIFSVFERLESILLRPNPRRLHIPDDTFPSSEDKSFSRTETPPLINFHIHPLDIDFVDTEANCFIIF